MSCEYKKRQGTRVLHFTQIPYVRKRGDLSSVNEKNKVFLFYFQILCMHIRSLWWDYGAPPEKKGERKVEEIDMPEIL